MSENWYIKVEDGRRGPVTFEKLRSLVDQGRLPPDRQVCKEGENWRPACRVAGLLSSAEASLLEQVVTMQQRQLDEMKQGQQNATLREIHQTLKMLFLFLWFLPLIWGLTWALIVGVVFFLLLLLGIGASGLD